MRRWMSALVVVVAGAIGMHAWGLEPVTPTGGPVWPVNLGLAATGLEPEVLFRIANPTGPARVVATTLERHSYARIEGSEWPGAWCVSYVEPRDSKGKDWGFNVIYDQAGRELWRTSKREWGWARLSPDGEWVYFGEMLPDETGRAWRVRALDGQPEGTPWTWGGTAVEFSGDGSRILAAGEGIRTVELYDADRNLIWRDWARFWQANHIFYDGSVLLGGLGETRVLDKFGKTQWVVKTPTIFATTYPLLKTTRALGRAYVDTEGRDPQTYLYVLDRHDGQVGWYELPAFSEAVLSRDGEVLLVWMHLAPQPRLLCLPARTGPTVGGFEVEGIGESEIVAGIAVGKGGRRVLIGVNHVPDRYFYRHIRPPGTARGIVYCLDETGRILWRREGAGLVTGVRLLDEQRCLAVWSEEGLFVLKVP